MPDRLGELAGQLDLGDLGSALATQPALGVLVALGVVGVLARVQRGLEQRPAQVLGAVLGDRAAAVAGPGLVDPRAKAGIAAQLGRRGEAADVADLGGDGVGVDLADARRGDQHRDVAVLGALALEPDGQLGDP